MVDFTHRCGLAADEIWDEFSSGYGKKTIERIIQKAAREFYNEGLEDASHLVKRDDLDWNTCGDAAKAILELKVTHG